MDNNINEENSKLIKVTTMEILRDDGNIVLSNITNNIHEEKNDISSIFDFNDIESINDTTSDVNNSTNVQNLFHNINEKGTLIFLHVLIMAMFEIYFYFNYVIKIEKKLLIDKINSYLSQFNAYFIEKSDENTGLAIKYFFDSIFENNDGDYLKNQSIKAKDEQ